MSLRLRLALWYGALTGLIVLLVGVLAYGIHSRMQYDSLDHALEGAVEHVAGMRAAAPTSHEADIMLEAPVLPHVVVRVYGSDGTLLASTPNAVLAPAPDPRALLTTPAGPAYDFVAALALPFPTVEMAGGAFGLVTDPSGNRWRLYVRSLPDESEFLVAETSLRDIDASVTALRRLVLLLALLGMLVTLVIGGLIAGRALRPVATLTETAAAIARSRTLDRRVPVGHRRDELGHLAATFNEMLASLQQAYQAQQRFVADASHELRAPLTAIQANLELIERCPDMPVGEQREALAEANREARRLARLVADLLALARADAGVRIARHPVELDAVVLQAFHLARQLADGHTITLEPFEALQVTGDEDRLKQLLLSLLDNALKYTPPGGRVTLGLQRKGSDAEIVVTDTGVGIPADALAHVFERFYRADPARGRDPGGTGLGLPIARWIVEQHGGEITLQSRPGKGTTVTVRLLLRL